ncbi:MAG: ComF family protein [Synechococcaceae cyanobacterium RL_1_2]|nr:ComF family protein [Synechococcaceae cyanobacterium RL_1_2]
MFKGFLNLFLNAHCPLCQRSAEDLVCRYCRENLLSCQRSRTEQFHHHGTYPLLLWGKYDYSLKRAIAAFKYENKPALGELLGEWLAEAWHELGLASYHKYSKPPLTVLPIPLHPAKLKQRGFNQAAIIAHRFAQMHNYRYDAEGLIRVKSTQPLFELNLSQRQQEMASAIKIGHRLQAMPSSKKNSPIIIVDDIYTTGTTVETAIKSLTASGFKVAAIVAIASSKQDLDSTYKP